MALLYLKANLLLLNIQFSTRISLCHPPPPPPKKNPNLDASTKVLGTTTVRPFKTTTKQKHPRQEWI
jgi:hypothetical protein